MLSECTGGRSARWLLGPALIGALLSLSGCREPVEKVRLDIAGQVLTVEVARTAAARERGLMGRRDLGPRDGMIFLFDRDQHLRFWMKDTPTALSIAFISADGRILQLQDMKPFSEEVVASLLSVRHALEMRQGAFGELGIKEGDTVKFPSGFLGTARIEP